MTKEERHVLGEVRDSQIRMEERQITMSKTLKAAHSRIDDQDIRLDNVEGHVGILRNNWKWLASIGTISITAVVTLSASGVI